MLQVCSVQGPLGPEQDTVLIRAVARHHFDDSPRRDYVFRPGEKKWVPERVAAALLGAHPAKFTLIERKPVAAVEEPGPEPEVTLRCLAKRHYFYDRETQREYLFTKGKTMLLSKPLADMLLGAHPDKFEIVEE